MENLPLASSAGSSVGDDSIVVSWGTQEGLRNNLTVETLVIWGGGRRDMLSKSLASRYTESAASKCPIRLGTASAGSDTAVGLDDPRVPLFSRGRAGWNSSELVHLPPDLIH